MTITAAQAHHRLDAFEEFMIEYRTEHWMLYANPNVPPEVKAQMDEAARRVFYRGFAAGLGSNYLSALPGASNTP